MQEKIASIKNNFEKELATVSSISELQVLKSRFIGKKGALSEIMKGLRDASPDERKEIGQQSNQCKENIEKQLESKRFEIEQAAMNRKLEAQWVDPTLRDSVLARGLTSGGYHPVTLVQREIEDIFLTMGFDILDGPHIESDYYNFEALNIPADHPARDMQDTFWFPDLKHLLRTHTSCVQVRGMEQKRPPFKFIVPGKCFRCERTDASHEMVFHQLEGMMVGHEVSVANLVYFMKTLLTEIFRRDVSIRLRPGFFPFVEPGFELDVQCLICNGEGCSVCKRTGWVELLPCGMVHPNVLRYGKIDPVENSGFAFGLGLDRLVMMRYEIDDIRLIHSADLRFHSQFRAF